MAPRADEGRGLTAISLGESLPDCDPGMSESTHTEHIGMRRERGELIHLSTHRKRTQTAITLVAASETVRVQTIYVLKVRPLRIWGRGIVMSNLNRQTY